MCKISVIIPVYNVEQYIEECLDSALNQTLKDIEVICVDDGSTDSSVDILKKYADQDDRVIVYEKDNGGQASARNIGVNIAKSEYVYFLDSDDYLVPDALEIIYSEAKEHNLDNLYFDAESFFETPELEKKHSSYIGYYERTNDYSEVVTGLELLKRMHENAEFRVSPCLQLLRREFLNEHNLRFEEGFIHEDDLFALEVCLYAARVKHIKQSLYMRRVRESSTMTGSSQFKHSLGYYNCVNMLTEKISQLDIADDYREVLIKRLTGLQSSAVYRIMRMPSATVDEYLENLSLSEEAKYSLFVRTSANSFAKINNLQNDVNKLKKRIRDLEKCNSYKIGRKVTYIPRKIKQVYKAMKKYSLRYIFSTIGRKINKNKVCVSIIIPIYNTGDYLQNCLEGIAKQSLKNIEVICVNDGSTDNSLEILEGFAKKDKRFKVINKENSGAGDSRNVGMKQAKGEYLLFLDSDDIFNKGLCYKAYRQAVSDNADICFVGAERLNMVTNQKEYMSWVLRSNVLPKKTPFSKEDIGEDGNLYFQLTSGCPWSKLFKRKFIEEHQIQFQNLKNSNDVYFVRTAMALADKLTYVDEKLITYRFAEGENTQSNKHKNPLEFYKAFKALKLRLVEEGCYDKLEQSFVNMVLNDSLFNYRTTTTPEAKKTIYDIMVNEGIKFFEFTKYPDDYYYNPNNVIELNEIFLKERERNHEN